MTIMLIGNKIDMGEKREVSFEEANKFAGDNGLLYMETSAKIGIGVREAFMDTSKVIKRRVEEKTIDVDNEAFGITVKRKPETKDIKVVAPSHKKSCCT